MVKHAYGTSSTPTDVVDRLLWRDAQLMLERHAEPDPDGQCVWCGHHWPCGPRRLAEQAEVAAFKPWGGGPEPAGLVVPVEPSGPEPVLAGVAAVLAEPSPASPAQRRAHRDEDALAGSTANRGPGHD